MASNSSIVYLKAKYLYIRTGGDIVLRYTNGSTVSLWSGFYRFLTSDLKQYNTNDQLVVEYDDDNVFDWFSTDTYISSVNDASLGGGGSGGGSSSSLLDAVPIVASFNTKSVDVSELELNVFHHFVLCMSGNTDGLCVLTFNFPINEAVVVKSARGTFALNYNNGYKYNAYTGEDFYIGCFEV